MKKLNEFLNKYIISFVLAFLYSQPFIDVLTFFSLNYFKLNISFGMITRFLFLIILIIYFLLQKNYKKEKYYLFIIFIYLLIFILFNIYTKDISTITYELKFLFRTFYLPILLITLIPLIPKLKDKIKLKNITILYTIYLLFIFVPNILGLGFNSYVDSKEGMIGWFNSANEISAIISILMPFVFYYFIKEKKYIIGIIYLIFTLYVLFNIGTKVPILSFIIVFILYFIYYICKLIKKKNYILVTISIISIFIIIFLGTLFIPKTSFYKNIKIHMNYLGMNNIYEVFTNYHYLDHFVFSERLSLLANNKKIYDNSTISNKLLGLGYIRNYSTDNISLKLVEMDYYDIYYSHGIIGTLIYFVLFIYILFKNKKVEYFIFISILLILPLSFFSGHILISPAVSFYVALILLLKGNTYEES